MIVRPGVERRGDLHQLVPTALGRRARQREPFLEMAADVSREAWSAKHAVALRLQ